ncbi:MAG TPA: acyl-CoA dehydrogenase family protein [Polyangiales bacterium]|nr:acyl-CoA dehydrogenase family protein [Polyangiales bacterium]
MTEDQAMLAKTASAFISEHSPVERLRKLRDAKDERGYSSSLYQQMAELGWTAIPFAERDGGLGMGLAGAILVTEALGRGLAPEPYLASILMGGQALALGGSDAQRASWLAPAIGGEKVLALAYQEAGSRYDACSIKTRAEAASGGYRLRGQKVQVLTGALADAYIVSARSAGADDAREGVSLFIVPAGTPGLKVTRQWRIDSQNTALLELDVQVPETALVGKLGASAVLLENVIDRATVGLAGEMLGGMSEAFDRTVQYLKERKQFGVLIGTFQALKHRAAKMFIEIELARSAVMAAARAIDEDLPDARLLVSAAKARVSDAYVLIANEAVQMHGGIGMTDEHEIGFFMKRARVCELSFGDAAFHRDRYARLSQY